MTRRPILTSLLVLAALLPASAAAAPPASCPGAAIHPTKVITGSFGQAQKGSYVMLPFTVPAGTTQVRVQYCYDKPESGSSSHTLDLGIYDGLRRGDKLWAGPEFRGWGGSSHPDVAISAGGFSPAADYLKDPKGYIAGRTTRGFLPGPVAPGRWAVELGVAAVIPKSAGDATGEVGWRVAIELTRGKLPGARYRAAPYRTAPVSRTARWYQGDFHVHDEHSNLGAATIAETLGYGFRSRAAGGAGLDFTALSDYVTTSAWGEIGRYQPKYPHNLIIPSAEVITYHGHLANQNAGGWVDYRTGPVLERSATGALTRLRGPTTPHRVFDQIHQLGGFSVINHPRIFPPANPVVEALCRGCYWNYSDAATDFRAVDAIEVMNVSQDLDAGPGLTANPFTAPAIAYWQHALASGAHVAALGGSDTHNAGRRANSTDATIGTPATNVYADELSADGIQRGVQDGHTFVKALGSGGPDLRLTARPAGTKQPAAIMGDSVSGAKVALHAQVLHAGGGVARVLELQRNGITVRSVPFSSPTASIAATVSGRGRYGLVLVRGPIVEAIGSPVYVNEPRARLRAALGQSPRLHLHDGTVSVVCRVAGTDVRRCAAELTPRGGAIKESTGALVTGGRVTIPLPAPRTRHARLKLTAIDRLGHRASVTRTVSVTP